MGTNSTAIPDMTSSATSGQHLSKFENSNGFGYNFCGALFGPPHQLVGLMLLCYNYTIVFLGIHRAKVDSARYFGHIRVEHRSEKQVAFWAMLIVSVVKLFLLLNFSQGYTGDKWHMYLI